MSDFLRVFFLEAMIPLRLGMRGLFISLEQVTRQGNGKAIISWPVSALAFHHQGVTSINMQSYCVGGVGQTQMRGQHTARQTAVCIL